ncbi:MAG: phosphatase PAP2 family protein [Anaerolineae bacterium]
MNLMRYVDQWLFTTINGQAGHWPWLDGLARLILNDYFVPTLLALTLLALWFEPARQAQQNQRAVLAASLSAALVNIIVKAMNLLYFRPRPFAGQAAHLLFYHPTDSSFPSNAAALGFAIAAGVWFYHRLWGWGLLLLAALFGLSRIFGGVHYPLDVAAGAILGWGSAWLVQRQAGLVDKLLLVLVGLAGKLGLA